MEDPMVAPPAAWTPAWALVRGYFSPATLFLLLNVVIGTIALTSSRSRRHHHDRHEDEHHKPQHQQQQQQQQHYNDQYVPPPAPLARTSSVVERLRSFGLYRFRSGDFPPEYNLSAAATIGGEINEQQAQYARSLSEPAARPRVDKKENAKAGNAAVKKSSSEIRKLGRARAPSQARVVQRAPRAPAREEVPVVEAAGTGGAGCVDARADDFINKFRQQLQLQRLNSLLNYKEMLNRGT